jgi:hypothetical protein
VIVFSYRLAFFENQKFSCFAEYQVDLIPSLNLKAFKNKMTALRIFKTLKQKARFTDQPHKSHFSSD